jgi:hypothetical protein
MSNVSFLIQRYDGANWGSSNCIKTGNGA